MKREKRSKHSLMSIFMMFMGLVLSVRLLVLTSVQAGEWKSTAEDMSVRTVYETAPRGDILDRNGETLATSRPVYSVCVSRAGMDRDEMLETAVSVMSELDDLGEDLNVTIDQVRAAVSDTAYTAYMPIVIADDASENAADHIQQQGIKGVTVSTEYVRSYPQGSLAAHILGYMGRISSDEENEYVNEKGYRKDALIGKAGIENRYEEKLRGTDSAQRFQVDSTGRVTGLISSSKAKKGSDVTLTIDSGLQKVTEDALEQAVAKAAVGGTFESSYGDYAMTLAKNAASGAAVAIDVKTGEVLAMASFPDYDPNDFAVAVSEEKWASLQQENPYDPMSPSPMYNTATMTAVQPGSAFKPVTALAALSCGLDEKKYLYDDGAVTLGERMYGCFLWNEKNETHGYVSLQEALKVSCNYYFFDIAAGKDFASGTSLHYDRRISNETITDTAKMLGLGRKTGIEIEESAGVLPSEELKEEGVKSSLRNYLLAEEETYFKKDTLKDRKQTRKNIEKIVKWADKDLTLEKIIGKLTKEKFIRQDKAEALASVCKFTYFDQIKWTLGDTFNISIGQGDNAYTTIQMASYISALANGGVRKPVTLIASRSRQNVTREAGIPDKADINYIISAMTRVTGDKDGSLYRAFAAFPYSVAAKTGTAQRAGKKSVEDEREYLRKHLHLIAPDITMSQVEAEAERLKEDYPDLYKDDRAALRRAVINKSRNEIGADGIDLYKEGYDSFAWTVALAPADDPHIAVAVMLIQGGESSNAAPVVREIIGKYGEDSQWEKSF